jgi:hypothetical protein
VRRPRHTGHVHRGPGFVDEHEAVWIEIQPAFELEYAPRSFVKMVADMRAQVETNGFCRASTPARTMC